MSHMIVSLLKWRGVCSNVSNTSRYVKRHHVHHTLGTKEVQLHPERERFESDIKRGGVFVVVHEDLRHLFFSIIWWKASERYDLSM